MNRTMNPDEHRVLDKHSTTRLRKIVHTSLLGVLHNVIDAAGTALAASTNWAMPMRTEYSGALSFDLEKLSESIGDAGVCLKTATQAWLVILERVKKEREGAT